MTYIPLHKAWQMNLLWPMDPPQKLSIDVWNTATPNMEDKPTLADGPTTIGDLRIDALNTATANLADKPSFPNDPTLVPEQT